MDLLNLLMDSMTSPGSTATLSQKTGVSKEQTASLVASALPLLLQSMQSNASTETGAQSLLNALTQHTNTQSVPQQIAHADTVDGAKILAHILGQNQTAAVNQLSKKNGLTTKQTMAILSLIAPALLSALSATTAQQGKKQGFDLSDIGTDYERIADHCSNIAVGVIEVNDDLYDAHEYIETLKNEKSESFEQAVEFYERKYMLPAVKF